MSGLRAAGPGGWAVPFQAATKTPSPLHWQRREDGVPATRDQASICRSALSWQSSQPPPGSLQATVPSKWAPSLPGSHKSLERRSTRALGVGGDTNTRERGFLGHAMLPLGWLTSWTPNLSAGLCPSQQGDAFVSGQVPAPRTLRGRVMSTFSACGIWPWTSALRCSLARANGFLQGSPLAPLGLWEGLLARGRLKITKVVSLSF